MANCEFYIKGGKCNHKDAPNPGHSRCVVSVCGVQEPKYSADFKAGVGHALSRAVTDGCLSNENGKHGVHIPDELFNELVKVRDS